SSFNDTMARVHDNCATILSTYILIIVVFMQQMMTANRKARGARYLHRRRPDGLGEYGVWCGVSLRSPVLGCDHEASSDHPRAAKSLAARHNLARREFLMRPRSVRLASRRPSPARKRGRSRTPFAAPRYGRELHANRIKHLQHRGEFG